tara:strand:+ start:2052 stop:2801 length:750 start_codon:yes stop_codon:yes gene_type:complete
MNEIKMPAADIFEKEGKLWAHCFNGPEGCFEEVELRKQRKSNCWVRRNTFDAGSLKDCRDNYSQINCNGKRVLDLGANIGGFSKLAHEQGASLVVALEPCPYNHAILKKNSPYTQNLQAGAIPSEEDQEINFYYTKSKRNSVSSSTVKRRNASNVSIKVPGLSFKKLLEKYKPQILKIDVEGAEYALLDSINEIPSYVEQAAFEFHRSAQPYASYPEKFFPVDEWESYEVECKKMINTMRDITFIRKRV